MEYDFHTYTLLSTNHKAKSVSTNPVRSTCRSNLHSLWFFFGLFCFLEAMWECAPSAAEHVHFVSLDTPESWISHFNISTSPNHRIDIWEETCVNGFIAQIIGMGRFRTINCRICELVLSHSSRFIRRAQECRLIFVLFRFLHEVADSASQNCHV